MSELDPRLTFEEIVAGGMALTSVPGETINLQVENSRMHIRPFGAYITYLALMDPYASQDAAIPVLHRSGKLTEPKLTASHAMSPVGPYDGPGGQHGFPRRIGYKVATSMSPESELILFTDTPEEGPRFVRHFLLDRHRARVQSHLRNDSEDEMRSSMGEHYYFQMLNGGGIEDILVDGKQMDDLFETDAIEKLKQGEALFWDGYVGETVIRFPDNRVIDLSAQLGIRSGENDFVERSDKLGMLIWTRKGEDNNYICFEPTAGYRNVDWHKTNSGLFLSPGSEAQLNTTIRMVNRSSSLAA